MTGKRLIIVGADYSDVSIGKLKISITSTKLSDGETATLTLSAPSVTATTLKAETSGSTITMTGSNPYTITAGSTEGTQEITCTLTYTDTTGKSVTETKKLTITVENTEPSTITWLTSHCNENTMGDIANTSTYAGFSYLSSSKGAEADGVSVNCIKLCVAQTGILTVGIASSDYNTIIDSEQLNITGTIDEIKIFDFAKTYTLKDGQHLFISAITDTAKFKYAWETPAPSIYAGFAMCVGRSTTHREITNQNLSVDFGYKS